MELKDYTTEELRDEIKRRYSLVQAEGEGKKMPTLQSLG